MLAMDCLRKCDGKAEPFILLSHVSHKLHSVTDSPFSCLFENAVLGDWYEVLSSVLVHQCSDK